MKFKSLVISHLLQVQYIEPEGEKMIYVLLVAILIAVILFFIFKRKKLPKININYSAPVKANITKNKIYHATIITLEINNRSKKGITIENPVIRFKRGRKEKAFKIKAVNSTQIYPLFLEAGKSHKLPVTLQPFYDFNKKLKRLSRVRIEFAYNKNRKKKTKYLLLKPTLFRKAKR